MASASPKDLHLTIGGDENLFLLYEIILLQDKCLNVEQEKTKTMR